jgi:hypothetical protein
MVVLGSGADYIKSEPEEVSPNCGLPSAPFRSLSTFAAAPLSPPSSQPIPMCECGDPAAEEQNAGYGNPENMYRMMYVCPRVGGKRCEYLKYTDEDEPCIKQESDSLPDVRKTPERQILPADSLLTPTTSPPKRPPPPTGTYRCNCHKPAKQFFCENENSLPQNVGKYYYKCADNHCPYWEWVESEEDAQQRIETRKQKREFSDDGHGTLSLIWNCWCREPAVRWIVKRGRPWNIGRGFYSCESRVCKFWVWDDGTIPLPALRAQRAALTYVANDPYAGDSEEDSEEEGSDEEQYDDGEYDAEDDEEEDDVEGEVHVDDVSYD